MIRFNKEAPNPRGGPVWPCTDVGLVFCTDIYLYIPPSVQTDKWRFGVGNAPFVLYAGRFRSATAPTGGRRREGGTHQVHDASALKCAALQRFWHDGFCAAGLKTAISAQVGVKREVP